MGSNQRRGDGLGEKVTLCVGLFALSAGTIIAYLQPAAQYELSIYTATPIWFWVGTAIAMVTALVVSLRTSHPVSRRVGVFLGLGSFLSIVGLPIIRNYHYYGTADAMTHLGWARSLQAGSLDFFHFFYPGIHVVGALISNSTGYPLPRSLLYVVVISAGLLVVSLMALAWTLTHDHRGVAIVLFSGAMFLPINHVGTHVTPHPITGAILISAFFLYLLARYVAQEDPDGRGWRHPSGIGVLLALAGISVVLYHGQQALNLFLLLAAIIPAQFVLRRWSTRRVPYGTRPVYGQTALLGIALLVWSGNKPRFWASVNNVTTRLINVLLGNEQVTSDISQRGASLTAIGASLPELFVKLFLVSAIFSGLAAVLMLANIAGRLDPRKHLRNVFVFYVTVGLVPLSVLMGVYMMGSLGNQPFRHASFIMVVVTLVGALAFSSLVNELSARTRSDLPVVAVVVVLVVMLALSLVVVFPSPYIYKHSKHVSDKQLDGYETALTRQAAYPVYGIRGGPDRYADAVFGGESNESRYRGITAEEMIGVPADAAPARPYYLFVSRMDYEREVIAYRELRYSREAFTAVRTHAGVNRVMVNGAVSMYHVAG